MGGRRRERSFCWLWRLVAHDAVLTERHAHRAGAQLIPIVSSLHDPAKLAADQAEARNPLVLAHGAGHR